jgi:hypothetical protein
VPRAVIRAVAPSRRGDSRALDHTYFLWSYRVLIRQKKRFADQ